MVDIQKKYEQFCSLVEDERVYINPFVSFAFLARGIRVSPRKLDKKIRREQGLGGKEILSLYRARYGRRLESLFAVYGGNDLAGERKEGK